MRFRPDDPFSVNVLITLLFLYAFPQVTNIANYNEQNDFTIHRIKILASFRPIYGVGL